MCGSRYAEWERSPDAGVDAKAVPLKKTQFALRAGIRLSKAGGLACVLWWIAAERAADAPLQPSQLHVHVEGRQKQVSGEKLAVSGH